MREIIKNKVYRHFKGNFYFVFDVAKNTETNEMVVVYKALYGNQNLFVRPIEMFLSEVDMEKYPNCDQKYRYEEFDGYYAVFKKNTDGGYDVAFPDVFGGVTCGDNLKDALKMASDLLKMMVMEAPGQCSKPTPFQKIKKLYPQDEILFVKLKL